MGRNFISLESVKIIACVGRKTNKFEQKEVYIGPTQNRYKKHETQFKILGPLGVKGFGIHLLML